MQKYLGDNSFSFKFLYTNKKGWIKKKNSREVLQSDCEIGQMDLIDI
jgi:hypothetical protein